MAGFDRCQAHGEENADEREGGQGDAPVQFRCRRGIGSIPQRARGQGFGLHSPGSRHAGVDLLAQRGEFDLLASMGRAFARRVAVPNAIPEDEELAACALINITRGLVGPDRDQRIAFAVLEDEHAAECLTVIADRFGVQCPLVAAEGVEGAGTQAVETRFGALLGEKTVQGGVAVGRHPK